MRLSGGMMTLPAPMPQPTQGDPAVTESNAAQSVSRPLRLVAPESSKANRRKSPRPPANISPANTGTVAPAPSSISKRQRGGTRGEGTKASVSKVTMPAKNSGARAPVSTSSSRLMPSSNSSEGRPVR